ncbi:MAG: hypothetical protein DI610_01990, partial [Staphylococcus hominis]
MDRSIYDFGLPRSSFQPLGPAFSLPPVPSGSAKAPIRGALDGARTVGLISNPRSHRNKGASVPPLRRPDVIGRAPLSRAELRDVLVMFARRGIDVLAIDGGDGTVRDVLTCAGEVWGSRWPDILLLPTGKTNALALDVGVPTTWSLEEGLAAAARGRYAVRSPLEVVAAGGTGTTVRGFILGVGAFVDATALAQRTHRAGAFNGVAVGLALTWGIAQTLAGGAGNPWRVGSRIGLSFDPAANRMHGTVPEGVADRYLLLASTLHRLPLGLKPFGRPRPGLKTLVVDAPPRQLAAMLGPLLVGSEAGWLERRGYHRVDAKHLAVDMATGFVLDGELFPAGAYRISE